MSSAKNLLDKNELKRQRKQEQEQKKKVEQAAKHAEFAETNMRDIQKLLKERCPLDYNLIISAVETFLKQGTSGDKLKLELPALSPPILSTLLYNMALWLGNTHAKEV